MKGFFKIFIALSIFGSAFFFTNHVQAQTYEAGGFIGLGLYKGELSNIPNPASYGGNLQILGKYNIDNYSSIRINISESIITGSDNNSNNLATNRNSKFSTTIGEFSFMYEHNFFPYRKEKRGLLLLHIYLEVLGLLDSEQKEVKNCRQEGS